MPKLKARGVLQMREVKEMCSAVQIPDEVKAELTEEQQVLFERYATAEAQGFLSATGSCQDKKRTGATASAGQISKEGAPKWQGDHFERQQRCGSLLGEYSNASTDSSQAAWCPGQQRKTTASAVDSNDADKEGKEIKVFKEGKEIKVNAMPIVPRVTFIAPVESVGPDQLIEIKDIPVEGDDEVWANRAEDRAVFISADVEADVKLEDEHDADV